MQFSSRITALLISMLATACASPPSPSKSPLSYEEQLDARLKDRPDDPDLLFLRHDHKNLARCLELARVRPIPMVLASVVSHFIGADLDEKTLPDYRRLLDAWIKSDPDNAMPVVLKAQLAISSGDLEGGTESTVRCSELARCDTYTLEARRETHRIQLQLGLDDIFFLGAVLHRSHYNLARSLIGACSLLSTLAFEYEVRGDVEQARTFTRASLNLAIRFAESNPAWHELSLALDRTGFEAARLCELMLMKGDEAAATEAAILARRSWREGKALQRAVRRDLEENPLMPAFVEAGLLKSKPESKGDPEAGVLDSFSGMSNATDETWNRFREAMQKREGVIRPYYENQIRKGEAAAFLERLTAEDRSALATMSAPIDKFWDRRRDFYTGGAEDAALDRQVDWLFSSDADVDVKWFMQERAFHALLHNGKGKPIPRLEKELDSDDGIGWMTAVIMVSGGNRDSRLSDRLRECADEYSSGTCWAAAKLGIKQVIPGLVETFCIEFWPDRVYSRFCEAVVVYLALRDLTGQDLGFNSEKWREWAKKEGYLKE